MPIFIAHSEPVINIKKDIYISHILEHVQRSRKWVVCGWDGRTKGGRALAMWNEVRGRRFMGKD